MTTLSLLLCMAISLNNTVFSLMQLGEKVNIGGSACTLDKHKCLASPQKGCAFQMQSWSDTDRRCYGGTGITCADAGWNAPPLSFSCPHFAEGEMLTCSWPSQNSKWRICTNVAGVLLSFTYLFWIHSCATCQSCALLLANILQALHCIVHLYIMTIDSIAVAESNSACSSGNYEVTNPLRASGNLVAVCSTGGAGGGKATCNNDRFAQVCIFDAAAALLWGLSALALAKTRRQRPKANAEDV